MSVTGRMIDDAEEHGVACGRREAVEACKRIATSGAIFRSGMVLAKKFDEWLAEQESK